MKRSSYICRSERGPKKIGKNILNGLTRDEYSDPYEDNALLAFVYFLYKDRGKGLSYLNIGTLSGWGWRTIKSGQESLRKRSIISGSIKCRTLMGTKKQKRWYMNNPDYLNSEWEKLRAIVKLTHYQKDPEKPNKPEGLLLEIANEVNQDEWKYTGGRLMKNRIGKYYPDLINERRMVIIEHYGSWVHHSKDEIVKELYYRENFGYRTISIWDYEEKDRNKVKRKIKESMILFENCIEVF